MIGDNSKLRSSIVTKFRNGESIEDISKKLGKSKKMCKQIYKDECNRRIKAIKNYEEVCRKRATWSDLFKIRNETLKGKSPSEYGVEICTKTKFWACGKAS